MWVVVAMVVFDDVVLVVLVLLVVVVCGAESLQHSLRYYFGALNPEMIYPIHHCR